MPSGSRASSTAWSSWTRRRRWSGPPCCGMTCARPTAAAELIASSAGRGWWASHAAASHSVVHRHQAALAGRRTSRTAPRGSGPVLLPHDWLTARLRGASEDQAIRSPAPPTRSPTAATRPAPGTTTPAEDRWLPGVAAAASATRSSCRGWPGPPRSSAGRRGARPCPPGPATTWARPWAWDWSPASWRCPSAPRAPRSRSVPCRPTTPPARWRLRRRHRPVPAPGLHDQRGPGAGGHGRAAGYRRGRPGPAGPGRRARCRPA